MAHNPTQTDLNSYITFSSGQTNYAFPVGNVRYIAAREALNVRETPTGDAAKPSQLFDYEGHATPLYRFCDLSGSNSQVDESAELVELLAQRQQDHIDWVDALEHSIRTGEPFTKATDPHKCAFGMWYDQYHPEDEELQEIMAAFDAPHKHIHSLGIKLTDLAHKEGKQSEAMAILSQERTTTLRELIGHFGRASLRLEDMVKPVVLVVTTHNTTYALEVEHIHDIQHFDHNAWLAEQCPSQDNSYYEGYFQTGDGVLYLNVLPEKLLGFAQGF